MPRTRAENLDDAACALIRAEWALSEARQRLPELEDWALAMEATIRQRRHETEAKLRAAREKGKKRAETNG
jgi:hypothetical protein